MGQQHPSGRGFDRRHGVTTHAILLLTELDPQRDGEARSHATHYEAVPVGALRQLLSHVPPDAIARSTFVDVGAGMGRAILLAREYPFKAIVGIELSPALHRIAQENLSSAHGLKVRCTDVRLWRADARKRRFPRGDLVVFLYNPFDAEALDAVLDRLAERPARGAEWILYHTPVHEERIAARDYKRVATSTEGSLFVSGLG